MRHLFRVLGAVLALVWGVSCWAAMTIAPTVDVLRFTLPGDGGAPREVAVAPLTPLCELIGATCVTEGDTLTVTRQERAFRCTLGTHAAFRNAEAVTLPLVPWRVDGEPYVPLRALVEALGGTVQPPGDGYTVTLPGLVTPLLLHEERVNEAPGRFENFATELYQIHLDGTGLRRLTYTLRDDDVPRLSRDGATLFYTDRRGICRRAVDDPQGQVLLAAQPSCAYEDLQLSPDGACLLYRKGQRDQPNRIGLVQVDGTRPRLLTEGESPCWTPDGRQIAFIRSDGLANALEWTLYLMRADGTRMRALCEGVQDVSFSPDGARFVYTRHLNQGPQDFTRAMVYVLTGTGAGQTYAFTQDPWPTETAGSFSPDGTHVTFADASYIYVAPAGGGKARRVNTPGDFKVASPCFTRDGQQILYTEYLMGASRLAVVSLRDGATLRLTNWHKPGLQTTCDPRLLPDGKTLLFTANGTERP